MSIQSDMQAIIAHQVSMGEGETVTYYPYQGIPRTISALVDRREPISEFMGGGEIPTLRYQVTVSNHGTTGIDHPQEGKDTFALKQTLNDLLPSTFRLARVVSRDSGGLTLEVVK